VNSRISGIIGMTLSCDGTHCVDHKTFLEKLETLAFLEYEETQPARRSAIMTVVHDSIDRWAGCDLYRCCDCRATREPATADSMKHAAQHAPASLLGNAYRRINGQCNGNRLPRLHQCPLATAVVADLFFEGRIAPTVEIAPVEAVVATATLLPAVEQRTGITAWPAAIGAVSTGITMVPIGTGACD